MVSEYANGRHRWLLTTVFLAWALSSFALAAAMSPISQTSLGKAALLFLLLAGVGQAMGGLFDINHKLHGPAAMIGIPSLCIAAVLTTMALARRSDISAPPSCSAHLPWIAFVAMLAAFALFLSALRSAGVDMSSQTGPLKELPEGVSGYVGWANRALFAATYLWAALASMAVIRTAG
jgi:peptidoglycan/LPS O-acetylase OafA/YrhL